MEIKDKGVNVVDANEDKIAQRMHDVLQNGIWELMVDLAEAMNVNGIPHERKLAILDEVSKSVMKTIKGLLTGKGYAPLKEISDILKKNIY